MSERLITREDKMVECQKCYHVFWIARAMPLNLSRCPHCDGLKLRIWRGDDGNPVYAFRHYNVNYDEKPAQPE